MWAAVCGGGDVGKGSVCAVLGGGGIVGEVCVFVSGRGMKGMWSNIIGRICVFLVAAMRMVKQLAALVSSGRSTSGESCFQ